MTPPGTSDVASTSVSVIGGQRPRLGCEHDRDVAAGEHRRQPRHEAQQRAALGRDDPDHAGRLRDREVEVRRPDRVRRPEHLGDLVGPARVPDPAVDRAARRPRGPAGVDPLGDRDLARELVEPALHELRDPVQDLPPVHRRPRGPRPGRRARHPDGVAEVLARRATGVRERIAVGGADEVRAAALGPRELPADVQLVGLEDGQAVRGGHAQRSSSRTYAWRPCMPPSRPNPDSL